MAKRIKVRPAEKGTLVGIPGRYRERLDATGERGPRELEVADSTYWRRRERDGSVTITDVEEKPPRARRSSTSTEGAE